MCEYVEDGQAQPGVRVVLDGRAQTVEGVVGLYKDWRSWPASTTPGGWRARRSSGPFSSSSRGARSTTSSRWPTTRTRRVRHHGAPQRVRLGAGQPGRQGVGHSYAMLTLCVAKEVVRRDLELGVVTMCIGEGQALTALFRRDLRLRKQAA